MKNKSLPKISLTNTGNRIKELRKERKLSVNDIAKYLGFNTTQAIYKW